MKSLRVNSGAVLVLGLALASTPMAVTAKSITVKPGQSIQAAVDAAKSGDTVKVLSGHYTEMHSGTAAVYITRPITLMASGPVFIHPYGDQRDGIVVRGTKERVIDGVEIKGFTVQDFTNNGIWLEYVNHFNIENNVSANNGENGIWPTLSANGQVKKNVAYGAMDSALWIEASQNVRVINNDLSKSPTGLEVTISRDVTIENNNIHDNTVGVGLYHPAAAGLPLDERPAPPYDNWHVVNNYVHDNNAENTAEPGSEVYLLPPGLGMLLLGVDDVDVQHNRIEKNDFVGVGMIDWCVALGGAFFGDFSCFSEDLPGADSTVDRARVVGNKFAGNHTGLGIGPAGPLPDPPFPPSDVLYVGADIFGLTPGTDNCQSDNKLIKTPGSPPPGSRGPKPALINGYPAPLALCGE